MMALVTSLGGAWTIEQPSGSILEFYPSFREIINYVFAEGGPYSVTKVKH